MHARRTLVYCIRLQLMPATGKQVLSHDDSAASRWSMASPRVTCGIGIVDTVHLVLCEILYLAVDCNFTYYLACCAVC